MIIESSIIFTDEYTSDLMGKEIRHEEEFVFDLKDVSGLMPGDESGSRTIIFLHGRDLLVKKPFSELSDLWKTIKVSNERLN